MMNSTMMAPAPVIAVSTIPAQLHFSGGLAPFLEARTYRLFVEADAPPFLRMECVDKDLAFVLVDPFAVIPDYRPAFCEKDVAELGLKPSDKPLILAIVNLSRGIRHATLNVAGPLLINVADGRSKQVVLDNAAQYSVRHPLT
jgi:flagellar assembly factor FliW